MQDLFRHSLRISNDERSGRSEQGVEMCASDWRPPSFLPDLRKTSRITGKESVCRFRCTVGDIAQRMNAHLELIWRMPGAQPRLAVAIDQWPKTVRFPADDGDHQWEPEHAGANKRAGCASDTEPNRQRVLQRARINSLSGKWRAVFARPVNVRVLTDVQKQIEFLGKQRIVILEFEPEQGKRF